MLSRRVPHLAEPNPWALRLAERRAAGVPLLDLTEANPTRVGLGGARAGDLAALAAAPGLEYRPDPRGSLAARRAVADYLRARGAAVGPEHVVLTASTSEGYAHAFRLLADPGECVLVPAPSYPLFEPLAAAEGVRVRPYPLAWDGRWSLDAGALEQAAAEPGARAVVVVQPNHPTGSCLDPDEIRVMERVCGSRGLAIVSDEVFVDFAWDPARRLPSLVGERSVLTLAMGGLSKTCGMPQMKAGWMVACGPPAARAAALRGLEWLADLFLSVSGPVDAALPRLLEARHDFQARVRARLAAAIATLRESLARRPELTWLAGEGGWTAVLRLPARRSGEAWALALLERDVVVHPGHFYDLEGEAYLVVSLIVEPAVLAEGLARLEALLDD